MAYLHRSLYIPVNYLKIVGTRKYLAVDEVAPLVSYLEWAKKAEFAFLRGVETTVIGSA